MHFLAGVFAVLMIGLILIDAFEAVLLPRRVTHAYRLIRLFYRATWPAWKFVAAKFATRQRRESFLSLFAPLSFLLMFAAWAAALILGFATLHWAFQTRMTGPASVPHAMSYLYFSGVTFFTLGYGDLSPLDSIGRTLAVLEAGLGFGFLAIVLSYHPVLAQAFSGREITISLLDARGGSPPSAEQVLVRCQPVLRPEVLNSYLKEWEAWAAELLERSLSYPVIALYRSQHDNQSWLGALTVMLDTSALAICGFGGRDPFQARLTFAIARHTAVDMCLIFKIPPTTLTKNRLPTVNFRTLIERLTAAGGVCPTDKPIDDLAQLAHLESRLAELRGMYEPFLYGLAEYLCFTVPTFYPERPLADNWQTSAWMPRPPGIRDLPGHDGSTLRRGDHF